MSADLRLKLSLPRCSLVLVAGAVAALACVAIHRSDLFAQVKPAGSVIQIPQFNVEHDPEIESPSWRLLHLVHPAHRQSIWHVTFSPDGKTIASAACDKTTRLWDVKTGRLQTTIRRPVNCCCVAFSPDGRTMAIAGGDSGQDPPGELVLWNLAKDDVETVFLDHATAKYVRWTAFSPNGKWLAAGGTDQTVTVWNVATGRLHRTLRGHTGLVASIAFSPDGKRLASGSFDKSIIIWDMQTGAQIAKLEGHDAEIRTVAYSSDGSLLLSTSDDTTGRLWDAETYDVVSRLEGHDGKMLCAAFSPDGTKLATSGMRDRMVLLRDVPSGNWADMRLFPRQAADIMSLAFSPDGQKLAIAGGFDNFQIWQAATGDPDDSK